MNYLQKIDKKRALTLGAFFLFCFIAYYLCNKHEFNFYNNYSYFADALLKGHLHVDGMPEHLESVSFMGHKYMHFAPGVSLLCLPFVALWGVDGFNCIYLAMFLGACNSVLAVGVLKNMGIGKAEKDRIWLAAMLTLGTVHFFCAAIGSSWFLGHVATLFFLLLAFYFLTKQRKTLKMNYLFLFLSGLFFGLAVTCRLTALLGGFFFLGWIWFKKEGTRNEKFKMIAFFALGAFIFGSLYMLYNYVRYGSIMDQGYTLTYLKDYHREAYDAIQAAPASEQRALLSKYKSEFGGPLQLKFIGYNLYSILFMAPEWQETFPYLVPAVTGVSITFTSPLLYWAVTADVKKKMTWCLWLSALLTAIPFLMNYGNGMAQFGMRYSLDFTPYLWLLMCYGLTKKDSLKLWTKVLIVLCFAVEIWGTLYWVAHY